MVINERELVCERCGETGKMFKLDFSHEIPSNGDFRFAFVQIDQHFICRSCAEKLKETLERAEWE